MYASTCLSNMWHFSAQIYTTAQEKGLGITVACHITHEPAARKSFSALLT